MGQISYRLISKDIDLTEFTCKNKSIDDLLKDGYYSTLLKQGFCYEIIVRECVVGYFFYTYALVTCNEEAEDSQCSSLMDFDYPAIHIKFIAINEKYQRKKIGTNVLKLFIDRAGELHKGFPIRFVVLDALKDLILFYNNLGFQPIDENDIQNTSSTIRMFFDLLDDSERKRLDDYTNSVIQGGA